MQKTDSKNVTSVSDIPTSKHWVDLVMANDKSIIIALILTGLGVGIFWYSFNHIQTLSEPPKAFRTSLNLITENCGPIQPTVFGHGDPDQFRTALSLYPLGQGETKPPLTDDDCWIRGLDLEVDWEPQPLEGIAQNGEPYTLGLIEASGFPKNQFEYLGQWMNRGDIENELVSLSRRDGQAVVLNNEGESPIGVSATLQLKELDYWGEIDYWSEIKLHTYSLRFTRDWQPESLQFLSRITPTPKTNFIIKATQFNNVENLNSLYRAEETYPLDISLKAWGEDVQMRVGELSPQGQIVGQGQVSFTIESGTVAIRREAGLIQYSTTLGIGVALLTEAFVIFLAMLVLEIGRRTWRRRQ